MPVREKLFLHLCCGPCGTHGWSTLVSEGFDVTGYFDGGNIHPRDEFLARRGAALQVAAWLHASLVTPDHDPRRWFAAVRGLEREPERGRRCEVCFAYQLERAAEAAVRAGATALCTSLTVSRHKDPKLINALGASIAARWGLRWEDRVWRKGDGTRRSDQLSKELGLYRQNFCGCRFSMRSEERDEGRQITARPVAAPGA